MEVIIEYAKKQNPVIEEVLSEHLNDGWSVQKEDGVTIVGVDIPDGKIIRLAELGVKVNTQLPKLEKIIQREIRYTSEKFDGFVTSISDSNTIEIMTPAGSVCGQITLHRHSDDVYFVHGNVEPSVKLEDSSLSKWIRNYLLGFDAFEKFLKKDLQNLQNYTISLKREYRVYVDVKATSFDEAFEKSRDAAHDVSFDDHELVEEEPVHAEREDGKEADYGYHPYDY